jgi:hypothetical protein
MTLLALSIEDSISAFVFKVIRLSSVGHCCVCGLLDG